MGEHDVHRARAVQVGLLMRSYRESFSPEGGRRGLTQEALLERMGLVDSDYVERYSHATVSRWESGGTRPTLQRLKVFGKALDLSRPEVAGLILLAGLRLTFERRWVTSPGAMVTGPLATLQRRTRDLPPTLRTSPKLRQPKVRRPSSGPHSVLGFSGSCRSGCA